MRNKVVFKYETTFEGSYKIVRTWMNGTVTLQIVAVTSSINIRHINPYQMEEES